MFKNALNELLKILDGERPIAANIEFGVVYGSQNTRTRKGECFIPAMTPEGWSNFCTYLDRDYDSGFGHQELYGTILLKANRWLERHEYDGSEQWELKEFPDYSNLKERKEDDEYV